MLKSIFSIIILSASIVIGLGSGLFATSIYAQTTQNPFPNNTETASELGDVIEGNDTTIIENNTNIGNPNNTLINSMATNQNESN